MVYASDLGGSWGPPDQPRRRPGPEVAVSGGAVFVGFTSSSDQLRLLRYRGTWEEIELTSGNPQVLVGVVASGGLATALGASFTSQRLYAVPDL